VVFLAVVKCPAGIFRHLRGFPQALVLLTAALLACSDDESATPGDAIDGGSQRVCTGKFKIEDLSGKPATETGGKKHIFDQKQFHAYKLEVETADWDWLNKNALKEEYVPAKLVFEGKRYHGAAVRYKGDWTSLQMCFDKTGKQVCPKLSLKVRFNKYDGCGRFHGMRRIMFNSSRTDSSFMRERAVWNMMKDVGMRGSRATHATLSVNGKSLGVFVMVEQVDKEYLEDQFKNAEGNLYKQVWPKFDKADNYIKALKTNEDDNPSAERMIQFAAALKKATAATAAKDLAPFIDLKLLAGELAMHLAIGNWDGPFTFRCWDKWCVNNNYYFYDEPGGLISMLPWDLDNTLMIDPPDFSSDYWTKKPASCAPIEPCKFFGTKPCPPSTPSSSKIIPVPCDNLLNFAVATNKAAYRAMLTKLPAALDKAVKNLDTWQAQIKADMIADKTGPGETKWNSRVKGVKAILDARSKAITAFLSKSK